jgi:hypothetical protein
MRSHWGRAFRFLTEVPMGMIFWIVVVLVIAYVALRLFQSSSQRRDGQTK